MNIESMSDLPALMNVPLDDQRCAVEAMRAGAKNFWLKWKITKIYYSAIVVKNDSFLQELTASSMKNSHRCVCSLLLFRGFPYNSQFSFGWYIIISCLNIITEY